MRTNEFVGWVAALAIAGTAGAAHGGPYSFDFNSGFANGGVVPDGNPAGWSDTQTISTLPANSQITSVSVSLNLSGGWNGDLYAYLSYTPQTGGGSGFVVLLNRVGSTSRNPFGYGDAGLNITLSDSASTDIHAYGGTGVPTGTYQADGRNVDPAISYDISSRSTSLADFDNLNGNGTWTLFFADMSVGDQSTVNGWGLQINAIPEPASVALGGVAACLVLLKRARWLRGRLTGTRPPARTH